jgi:uncharacterized pyridoxal phosphate-dependent enzyme
MGIYDELGIQPFINAYRPLTRLGGATLPPQVIEAMRQASLQNVDMRALQRKVGARIAAMTGNEAAYVSCGAASGITLAVAACMAGTNTEIAERLPNSMGLKNKVIMHRCERGYKSDVAISNAGALIVDIGTAEGSEEGDLRAGIDDCTAAIFVHDAAPRGQLPIEKVIAIARTKEIPVLVDAAFSVPPIETLWKFTRDMGADAVFVSGGKGLCGPQSTGLVLGKRQIVEGCAFHGSPNDRIGRGMKVGKEELAGIYVAVKLALERDDRKDRAAMLARLDRIIAYVKDMPGVLRRVVGGPRASLSFDRNIYDLTPEDARQWLLRTDPSIYVEPASDGIIISTECLDEQYVDVVGRQIRTMLIERVRLPGSKTSLSPLY